MKNCSDFHEILLSDLHGELDPEDRQAWEEHLAGCAACREERERTRYLMARVREELSVPGLSREKAGTLSRAIHSRLRAEGKGWSWWKRFIDTPRRLIPAAAAAMLLVVAVTWFSQENATRRVNRPDRETTVAVRDGEVIRHLELLEEMDTLRKLVHVLDEKETL
jgi:anti-sigma factor RsiW